MKILIPFVHPTNLKIDSPNIFGGTEKFCQNLYNNFDDVFVFHFDAKIFDKNEREFGKQEIKRFHKYVSEINPDILVVNYSKGPLTNKNILDLNIPTMFISHRFDSMRSWFVRMDRAQSNGHSHYIVGPLQEKAFTKQANRTGDPWQGVDGFIRPSYVEHEIKTPRTPTYDVSTIGRFNSEKKPMMVYEMCKDKDLSYKVFSSKAEVSTKLLELDGVDKYFEKYKNNLENVVFNQKHSEVIENLSYSKVYFSTWDKETYGITALEALSCGIPCILNGSPHSSSIIPADQSHVIEIERNNKDQFYEAYNELVKLDRLDIMEKTRHKHSQTQWKLHMKNELERTIKKYNSKSIISLESFME